MLYILAIIKKEFIEIIYSKKNIALITLTLLFFLYMSHTTYNLMFNVNNVSYLIAILISMATSLQFMSESILSDKRNQTLEIMLVAKKLEAVFIAKMITIVILSIIPFVIFHISFLIAGINILDSVFMYFNTLFLFWIGGCVASMIVIFFNDERSAALFGISSLLIIIGLIRAMFFITETFSGVAGMILLYIILILTTFAARLLFKNTKIYLKNL